MIDVCECLLGLAPGRWRALRALAAEFSGLRLFAEALDYVFLRGCHRDGLCEWPLLRKGYRTRTVLGKVAKGGVCDSSQTPGGSLVSRWLASRYEMDSAIRLKNRRFFLRSFLICGSTFSDRALAHAEWDYSLFRVSTGSLEGLWRAILRTVEVKPAAFVSCKVSLARWAK